MLQNRPQMGSKRTARATGHDAPSSDEAWARAVEAESPTPDHVLHVEVPASINLAYFSRDTHHDLPAPSLQKRANLLRAAAWYEGEPHQIACRWLQPPVNQPAHVTVATWGPSAATFANRARDLLGLNDATAANFDPQTSEGGTQQVVDWWQKHPGLRLNKRLSVLDTLIPIIIAQRILGKEAKHIHRRLYAKAGTEPPGPTGISLPPSAEALCNIGYESWHQMGLERSRARLIHECARNAERLESWRDLETEQFYNKLTAIPRIGPWTANRLLYSFGHADAVWIGDYNLPSFVAWNLKAEARADDARMLELLEPYRGHRARVLRLMEFEGSTPPRFGPRLPLRNIQHH